MGNLKLAALIAALVAFGVSLIGAGTASATLMCIETPEGTTVLKCPEPGKFAYGVDFIPESHIAGTLTGNATFELVGSGTVTCNESTFTLALKTNGTSNAGEGITKTAFNSNGGNCTTNIGVNTVASVTPENLSYDGSTTEYLGVNEPQGHLTIAKSGGNVQVKIVLLKSATTCIYKPNEALTANWANASGGKQSQATFSGKKFTKVSGAACPTEMRFTGTYNLKAESANKEIYITKE